MKTRKTSGANEGLEKRTAEVVPTDRLYSEHHIWVKKENEGVKIGTTDFAGQELGEVDFVELPGPGDLVTRHASFGIVETSKAVTDLIAPISGTVKRSNEVLEISPNLVTVDPYEQGWLLIVDPSDPVEMNDLMGHSQYRILVHGEIEDNVSSQVEILKLRDY